MDDDLDALERVMLANLLEGRTARRRPVTTRVPRANAQQGAHRQPPAQARRLPRPQGAARTTIPAPTAPAPAEAAVDRRVQRILDIGRVIKQIDPRTTPEQRRDLAGAWAALDLTAAQVQAWLAAGILPNQYRLAGQCLERGLAPEDVKRRVDGERVVDRLRAEGVDAALALVRQVPARG